MSWFRPFASMETPRATFRLPACPTLASLTRLVRDPLAYPSIHPASHPPIVLSTTQSTREASGCRHAFTCLTVVFVTTARHHRTHRLSGPRGTGLSAPQGSSRITSAKGSPACAIVPQSVLPSPFILASPALSWPC